MTYNDSVATGKPYITGFILGLVAAPIIAFSAGWVSTSGAGAEAVENARIETLAGVCSDTVQKSFASQNMDLATLKGGITVSHATTLWRRPWQESKFRMRLQAR